MSGEPGTLALLLQSLSAADDQYASRFVDAVLESAREARASDVHVQPTAAGIEIRWRLDGVLQRVGVFPPGKPTDVVARLKVLAGLLTYRTDLPQEGRLQSPRQDLEIRVSTFPTLHGERAVVRFFAAGGQYDRLADLGLPSDVEQQLAATLQETSGSILICGPAGSGKTTTAYACLREIVASSAGSKSLVSLEDPIEVAVEGVAQSQIQPSSGFDHAIGLRSLMRQDPEVILVGEIRDWDTAVAAFQAALTGHLVITTFHSGSAAGALGRLLDMNLEPFQLRNGILAVVCQRLVRRLCTCAEALPNEAARLQLPLRQGRQARGCPRCLQTGYQGRGILAELLTVGSPEIAKRIVADYDLKQLAEAARQSGAKDLLGRAIDAVEAGVTSPAEVRRVLGFAGLAW